MAPGRRATGLLTALLAVFLTAHATAHAAAQDAVPSPPVTDAPNAAPVAPPVVPPAPSDALAAPTPFGQTPPPGYGALPQLDAYDGSLHLPLDVTARLRALDRDLMALGVHGTTNLVDGVISLVAGAGMIALGVAFTDSTSNGLSTFLYVSGAGLLARAAIEFFVEPNPLEPAVHYAHMPMRDRPEVDLRLHYGETALASLSNAYFLSRVLEASVSISTAVGLCLAYYIPNGFTTTNAVSWIVAIFAGISVVTGIATLLTRSDAERRWDAYREMRDRLSAGDIQVALAPIPGGAAAAAQGHF